MQELNWLTKHAGGSNALIELSQDHPGFLDLEYRRRRNNIAQIALQYKSGVPIPIVEYSKEEDAVWNKVLTTLQPLHAEHACVEISQLQHITPFPTQRVPQLREINSHLITHASTSRGG